MLRVRGVEMPFPIIKDSIDCVESFMFKAPVVEEQKKVSELRTDLVKE